MPVWCVVWVSLPKLVVYFPPFILCKFYLEIQELILTNGCYSCLLKC